MIVVTTGTNGAPFDRLLRELDGVGGDEEVVVQRGPSAIQPSGARCVDYLAFDELAELVGRATKVVMHAGAGSILLALLHGHRPIVVPRLREHGEAVDDHQLVLARRLHGAGVVRLLEDPARIRDALLHSTRAGAVGMQATGLSDELAGYVASLVDGGARR